MTAGVAISLVLGFYLFQAGLITLGTVYLIVTYTNLLRRPIRELTQQVENLQNIGAATERLRELRAIQRQNHRRPRRRDPRRARWPWPSRTSISPIKRAKPVLEADRFRPEAGHGDGAAGAHRFRQDHPGAADLPPVRPHPRAASRWAACPLTQPQLKAAARAGGAGHPGCAALPGQRARQHHLLRPQHPRRAHPGGDRRAGPDRLAGRAAQRAGYQAGDRRAQHLGRRGAAAGLHARLPARSRAW